MTGQGKAALERSKVLVTGGAGFIGSHLTEELLRQGASVRVLDNLETGRKENLSHLSGDFEFITGDIRRIEDCQKACQGIDYVLHQAALGSVPRSLQFPAATLLTNVTGTANLFTAARDQNVRRIVFASSSSVYGTNDRLPKREGEEGQPISPYALSKRINEETAEVYVRCFGMQIVGLRYFNVYGPRQAPNGPYAAVIPKFFASCRQGRPPVIYGGGTQSRDFTFVADVVAANIAALAKLGGEGQAFNVGAGKQTTITELAKLIAAATGVECEPEYSAARAGDVLHSLADASRIGSVFDWHAQTPLVDGIALCSQYY